MIFYLGCHQPLWLERANVPWFLSYQKLKGRKKVVNPICDRWALDCGGFTEIDKHGQYTFTEKQYATDVLRFQEWGSLEWCASMDWPCSPLPLEKSGLTVDEHQLRTILSFQILREQYLGDLVKPVLQGWELDDYLRHVELYEMAGYDLTQESIVSIGSLVRGAGTTHDVTKIVRPIAELGIPLHALGVKGQALQWLAPIVKSADSMAWASAARGATGDRVMLQECQGKHKHCGSCLKWALVWHERFIPRLNQLELL